MDDVLRQAMEPVLRDVGSIGLVPPRIGDDDWADDPSAASGMLWSADGSGMGVRVDRLAPEVDRVAAVADQVQEWAIEELWGQGATNWPPCPRHPDRHPLQASTKDGVAVWVCSTDDCPIAPIGALRSS